MDQVESFKAKFLRGVVRLLSILPLPVVQMVGSLIGNCSWLFNGRSAKVTRRNLELCFPELDESERRKLARRSMVETGKTFAEMGKAWLSSTQVTLGYIKGVTEELNVNAAIAKGNGVITIVPHLGNWEVLNLYAAKRFPLHVLYQPPKITELEDYIRNARTRMGTKMYPTDRRGVAAMYEALRNGEVIGILPDQEPPLSAGIFAPFFGIDALTATLISKLAQKTGAKVMCAYAKRLPKGKGFEIVIKKAEKEIYSEDLQQSVTALNKTIENCVSEAVAQYQWEYKRFKKGWNGKTGYYNF